MKVDREKVLFVGGPGNISTSTAQDLVRNNYEVGIFTLPESPAQGLEQKVKFYRGDRNKVNELEAAIADFKADIVIDMVCFTPVQAQQIAGLIYGKVSQYIFTSTSDVYGYPLSRFPSREIDLMSKPDSKYAVDKRACEEIFLSRFDERKFPLTIVRPIQSFGRRFLMSTFSPSDGVDVVIRLRSGLPILVPGDGTKLIQPSYAYDTGRMIAAIVGQPVSIGKIYNCGREQVMTQNDFIRLIGSVVGKDPNLVHVPTDLLFSLDIKEIPNNFRRIRILKRFHHLCFSIDAFKADFPTFRWKLPLKEGIKQFVEWNDKNGNLVEANLKTWKDKVIKKWKECIKNFKM